MVQISTHKFFSHKLLTLKKHSYDNLLADSMGAQVFFYNND